MPSGDFVLDASALLCLIFQEPGADRVEACLPGARMGAANPRRGDRQADRSRRRRRGRGAGARQLDLEIVPLDRRQAETAGYLRATTKGLGLSLGDRCCLALTEMLDANALTTDRAWTGVPKHIAVEVVR